MRGNPASPRKACRSAGPRLTLCSAECRREREWAGLYAGFCPGAEAPWTVISLGGTSPCRSSGLPGDSAGRVVIPCLALLRARFTVRAVSPRPRWSLTPPFHPYRDSHPGGLLSVALSRGSLRVGVTHRPALRSPDVPRREAANRSRRDRPADPFASCSLPPAAGHALRAVSPSARSRRCARRAGSRAGIRRRGCGRRWPRHPSPPAPRPPRARTERAR